MKKFIIGLAVTLSSVSANAFLTDKEFEASLGRTLYELSCELNRSQLNKALHDLEGRQVDEESTKKAMPMIKLIDGIRAQFKTGSEAKAVGLVSDEQLKTLVVKGQTGEEDAARLFTILNNDSLRGAVSCLMVSFIDADLIEKGCKSLKLSGKAILAPYKACMKVRARVDSIEASLDLEK